MTTLARLARLQGTKRQVGGLRGGIFCPSHKDGRSSLGTEGLAGQSRQVERAIEEPLATSEAATEGERTALVCRWVKRGPILTSGLIKGH